MRKTILFTILLSFPFLSIGKGLDNFRTENSQIIWEARFETIHSIEITKDSLFKKFTQSGYDFENNKSNFHCNDVFFDYRKTNVSRSKCPIYLLQMKANFDVEILFDKSYYYVKISKIDLVEFKSIPSLNHNYHDHIIHHSLEELALKKKKRTYKRRFEKYGSEIINQTLIELFDLFK
ncbi:hypothetical protein K5X82_03690 [Halosquirtibacter xylanolyticus]|uniref:hypothetical protein n=1 Tax=Halosquirtibacter xylanolyticus TaxID=3374599 RepID=UPI003749A358|nr:hypothetical protein K5X82_03690 [Prolixibacteraceae bacterium]